VNWDLVLAGFAADLAATAEIMAAVGDAVYQGGEVPHRVPSVVIRMLGDAESELWAPVTLQVDIFHKSFTTVRALENIVRRRYHAPLPIPIGGLNCWAQFTGGSSTTLPERDGYTGRALRFTFTPLRAAYTGG